MKFLDKLMPYAFAFALIYSLRQIITGNDTFFYSLLLSGLIVSGIIWGLLIYLDPNSTNNYTRNFTQAKKVNYKKQNFQRGKIDSKNVSEHHIHRLILESENRLRSLIQKDIQAPNDHVPADKVIQVTIKRLQDEIKQLGKRSNLNLIIGILFSITALLILGYSLYKDSYFNYNELLIKFLPKLTLALFIEGLSVFFLRLYKSSLDDIKYYQNELTNIEQLRSALLSAAVFENDNKEQLKKVIDKQLSIERNFILKKDETTVELEKSKHETESLKEVLKASLGALGKKGS